MLMKRCKKNDSLSAESLFMLGLPSTFLFGERAKRAKHYQGYLNRDFAIFIYFLKIYLFIWDIGPLFLPGLLIV